MSLDWSPADLGRQRRLVRGIALRAETDRRLLQSRRRELTDQLMRSVSSPVALAGLFLAGFVVGKVAWRSRETRPAVNDTEVRPRQRRHPLRMLLAAWLWWRRSHAQIVKIKERVAPTEPPTDLEAERPAAIPPSDSIH